MEHADPRPCYETLLAAVKEDFTPELRWVCSEANWAADSLTRPERTEHVRLSQAAFDRLWGTWGGGVIWT